MHFSLFWCGLPRGSDYFGAFLSDRCIILIFFLSLLLLGRFGVSRIIDLRSAISTQAVFHISRMIITLCAPHAVFQWLDFSLDTLWFPGPRGVRHQATPFGAPVLRVVSVEVIFAGQSSSESTPWLELTLYTVF